MGEAMTKRLISAVPLLLIGLPGIAAAADLSTPPAYKAPAIAPAPYYNWNGFYIGANIGGGFGDLNYGNTITATGVALAGNSANVAGVVGGGQIGYNYMMSPNFLIGFEADFSGANINGSTTAADGSTQHSFNTDWFGTVRGRAGLTWNNWLLYGTGGFAYGDEQVTRNQLTGTIGGAVPGTSEQVSATSTGWTAGGGIEWGIAQNWTARVEYLYVDLGTNSYSFPISGRTTTFDNAFNVVRFGVNYKF
jgi:outer membrane immunogenic protein